MGNVQMGQLIENRYRVEKSLGTGGMAEVFLAEDTRLGRKVAMKVVRMDEIPLSMQAEVHKRFEREPRALARMQHPNIVSIHDYGFIGEEPFFIMDYIAGGSFDKLIKARLNYREVARLLAPVADALAYAHDQQILHRDVKPSNILITTSGQPVLMDFGIAKVLSHDARTSITQAGMSVGTPAYMAPEQWRGEVFPQTDGYALGIVFYQMLTGEVPYTDEITMNVALKHMTEPIPQLCKTRPDLPADIDLFLRRALAKDKNDRFVSMHQYREALNIIAQGGSLSAFLGEDETELRIPTPPGVRQVRSDETPTELPQQRFSAPPPQQPPVRQPQSAPSQQFPDGYYPVTPPQSAPKKKGFPVWGWFLIAFGALAVLAVVIIALVLGSMIGKPTPSPYVVSDLNQTRTAQAQANISDENNAEQQNPTNPPQAVPTDTPRPEASTPVPTYTALPTNTVSAGYQDGDSIVWQRDNAVMVYVSAGTFLQGSEISVDPDTYTINEGPIREVYLDAFWIDETEVTNEQFAAFVDATGYTTSAEQLGSSQIRVDEDNWNTVAGMDWQHPDGTSYSYNDDYPVVHVSWYDAAAYCKWAGKKLPTEAQWEKAARGPDGNKYPWGFSNPTGSLAMYGDPDGAPRAVRSYPSGVSYYGAYEMAGNVWELVNDFYERDYYQSAPNTNPTGPSSGDFHVAKGGSYGFEPSVIRSAVRVRRGPSQSFSDMGFRCVAIP